MDSSIGWPLVSNVIRRNSVSNTFGMVRKRADGTPKPHQGWDFFAEVGTSCFAIADGTVVFSGDRGDFGLIVVHSFVSGGKTFFAAYAHLETSEVKVTQKVSKGDLIGTTGKSGNAFNLPALDMHLHFEIRTEKAPGLGLAGRISPFKIYGKMPLNTPIVEH